MARAPFWGLNEKGDDGAEGPDYFTDPWETAWIGGMQLPGYVELRGLGIATIDLVVKKAKGHTGARVTYGGYDPKQFEFVIEISKRTQWDIFQDICDKLWQGPKRDPKSNEIVVDVRHPDLLRMKVSQAALIGTPPGTKGGFHGAKNFSLRFQEHVAPKKSKVVSAKGSMATVVKDLQKRGTEPKNGAPAHPSEDKKNFSIKGPPRAGSRESH